MPTKGKGDTHVFDILAVHRGQSVGQRLNNEEYRLLAGSTPQLLIEELTAHLPPSLQDAARARLLAEVESSEIFSALQVGQVLKYENGRLRHLSGRDDLKLPVEEVRALMRRATRLGQHQREVIIGVGGRQVFDLHSIPFDYRSGGLLALEVTEIIEKERKMHRQEIDAYREAMLAVTGGRLFLSREEEIQGLLGESSRLVEGEVFEPTDIPRARAEVNQVLSPLEPSRRYAFILCLSKALTNALKHAGWGQWSVQ